MVKQVRFCDGCNKQLAEDQYDWVSLPVWVSTGAGGVYSQREERLDYCVMCLGVIVRAEVTNKMFNVGRSDYSKVECWKDKYTHFRVAAATEDRSESDG